MVLKFDPEQERVSLGLKQILPDPWHHIAAALSVGQMVTGTVSRIVPFGAFVRLESGIEGIIPNSELAERRVSRPEEVVSAGQPVQARITAIRPGERRLTLSLREAQQEKERKEFRDYMSTQESGRVTLGDLVGDMFAQRAEAAAAQESVAPEPAEAEGAPSSSASPEVSPAENPPSPNTSDEEAPSSSTPI
jgi:predicted RNA-binding protein with RPS1 domain